MKKVFYLLILSLIFVYGCSNEDSDSLDLNQQEEKFRAVSIDGKDINSGKFSISLEEMLNKAKPNLLNKAKPNLLKSEDSQAANGHFSTVEGNTITFSSGEDGEYGNFGFKGGEFDFKGYVVCATVEENRAVLQVVVNKVKSLPEGFPDILGWTFLYLFEDNGEGNNAPSDRYFSQALNAPFTIDQCDGISPSIFLFIIDLIGAPGEWTDTAKSSDQIQIQ